MIIVLIDSPAFATTQKVLLSMVTGYSETNPRLTLTSSYATFTKDQGDNAVTISITMKNAPPKTKYFVHSAYPIGEAWVRYYKLGSLTTNAKGNWGGQNQQYSFQKGLPPGDYAIVLEPVDTPVLNLESLDIGWFWTDFTLTN